MNDCVNAEMRDRLPDLVHDRLSADDRTIVLAHVEACADCRDELQLLRDAKTMFARGVPRVDVAYVVGALPKAPAARIAARREPARRTRTWNDWRIAAAVTLLIAGGGSYAVMNTHKAGAMVDTAVMGTAPAAPTSTATVAMIDSSMPTVDQLVVPIDDQPAATANLDTRLGDLDEDQLNVLLKDMDNLGAVPASEPEPMAMRVDGGTSLEDM
jgi:anti-sigma factor RsiW